MGNVKKPFLCLHILSSLVMLFGVLSVIIGIGEMMFWLWVFEALGVKSPAGTRRTVFDIYGGISGATLIFITACGLWCGIWVAITGVCGCCIQIGRPSDSNNRTRVVVFLASIFNAVIFCPAQLGLYAWVFTPINLWKEPLPVDLIPVVYACQYMGISTAAISFILSIITAVVSFRTKPYEGQTRSWQEYDI